MPPKKQHHKTQSSEISTQAIMNYLSNREGFHARMSNSPTLQLDFKVLSSPTKEWSIATIVSPTIQSAHEVQQFPAEFQSDPGLVKLTHKYDEVILP